MFTECLQYGRYRARYYRDKQYTPTKRNTESNAGRLLSKEITIKQMAKMLRDQIHCGQERRERDLLVTELKDMVGNLAVAIKV